MNGEKTTLENPFGVKSVAGGMSTHYVKTLAEARTKAQELAAGEVRAASAGRIAIYKAIEVVEPTTPPLVVKQVDVPDVPNGTKPTP